MESQIDVVLYYAPILFRQAGFTSKKASFLSSGVTGIVMLVAQFLLRSGLTAGVAGCPLLSEDS
jgi:hypothetical protein